MPKGNLKIIPKYYMEESPWKFSEEFPIAFQDAFMGPDMNQHSELEEVSMIRSLEETSMIL